jgi:hypothetical protein
MNIEFRMFNVEMKSVRPGDAKLYLYLAFGLLP